MDEDTPKKDPKKLILEEFQLGKPIFESYNKFCKTMGPKFLDYPEFEFWWMRFSAGNFDINYDRSQDPKYRTIEDIPVNIFEKICGNLKDDVKNNYWFTLRHVCKSFCNIVDSWTSPKFYEIEISSFKGTVTLSFNEFEISYAEKSENLSEIGFKYHPNSLQRGNFRDLAIDDLTKILAGPDGFKLENLKIYDGIDDIFAQKLFETFKNLPNKIQADNVALEPGRVGPKMDKKTSQKDTKQLILKEFRLGKPIFESYKNFCKKMGSKFMDYPEFEFWWMRFSAGNFDLDHDRSQDPKCRNIEDIPVDIFQKICGNLKDDGSVPKNKYWFTLRHVCKSFCNIFDSWTSPKFVSIGISFLEGTITLFFDGFQVSYIEKSGNVSEIGLRHHPKSLQRGNFRDLAIDDLTKILAVPESYKQKYLNINGEIDNVFAQKLFEKFENRSKIHVGTVYLHPSRIETIPVNNILNLCQSIEEIDIKSDDLPDEEFTGKLKGITALNTAEMVTIHCDERYWDPTSLMMPRITALLGSPHLEYCHVTGHFQKCVRGLKTYGAEIDPENSDIYRCPIPNSDDFFEITFAGEHRYFRPIKTSRFNDAYIERKSNST